MADAISSLITEPNLADPDGFYESLIKGHEGLSDAQSQLMNARLVLLLANHIGETDVLTSAIAAARSGVEDDAS